MVPVVNKKDWPLYLRSFRVTLVLGSTSTWVASSKRGGSLLCGWKFTCADGITKNKGSL